jgi:hypothetical protein
MVLRIPVKVKAQTDFAVQYKILVITILNRHNHQSFYFPSNEIMLDELLRDYRFSHSWRYAASQQNGCSYLRNLNMFIKRRKRNYNVIVELKTEMAHVLQSKLWCTSWISLERKKNGLKDKFPCWYYLFSII